VYTLVFLCCSEQINDDDDDDVTDDVPCAAAVATCWVYVVKQHYRCSNFNVEFVWRQFTECQRVQILCWINSLLLDLCNTVHPLAKYKCEKRASNIALCYGVDVDESSFYCSTAPCLYCKIKQHLGVNLEIFAGLSIVSLSGFFGGFYTEAIWVNF